MSTPSTEPVRAFFAAFTSGDSVGLFATLHEDVIITAEGPGSVPWYGHYTGHTGATAFLQALGGNVETQQFTIATLIGEGDTVMAAGQLAHRIRTTGRLFASDWALRCIIADGKIAQYTFFENTAAAAEAFQAA